MFDSGRCILVTNNNWAAEEWGENIEWVVMVEIYEEVLLETRDLTHTSHKLLTYPQVPSLEPNQTPYRTILLHSEARKSDVEGICLIKEAIETLNKWTAIKKVPRCDEKIAHDYKTISLLMIKSIIPKLQG